MVADRCSSPATLATSGYDLRGKPEWQARVMRQAERLGMDVSDYIRQATTLKLEQDEATEPDLQQEGGDE